MIKKYMARIIICALILGLMGWLVAGGSGYAQSLEKVSFVSDWVPYGFHVPFYAAFQKGFYKDAGLDLTISRGYGSDDTAKKVAAKVFDFGLAMTGNAVLLRAKGGLIKSVAMHTDKGVFVIFSLKKNNILSPKDLEGKSFGSPPGGADTALWPAFAKLHGLKNVKWISMTPEAKNPSLLAGSVDFIITVTGVIPALRRGAEKEGKQLNSMLLSDYGLDMYAYSIITTEDMIKDKPDVVRKFVQTSFKGIAWSIENPKEAVELFLKLNPEKTLEIEQESWEIAMDHMLTESVAKHGIGWIDEKKMQDTIDLIAEYMNVPKIKAKDFYTNEFLPKLFPKRAK